jgi:hypothetical protein
MGYEHISHEALGTSLKLISPVVLRIWSHVNGLKEAPLQNSISAIFAETWNRVKNEIDPYQ